MPRQNIQNKRLSKIAKLEISPKQQEARTNASLEAIIGFTPAVIISL
ncbi:MAG: hypothetical protein HIU91_16265 [Acidobacteria bacterium]|nr:hypothetical protein [Acidobacteriota bacterium]